MITSNRLSLEEAELAVDAALAKAAELGVGSVIARVRRRRLADRRQAARQRQADERRHRHQQGVHRRLPPAPDAHLHQRPARPGGVRHHEHAPGPVRDLRRRLADRDRRRGGRRHRRVAVATPGRTSPAARPAITAVLEHLGKTRRLLEVGQLATAGTDRRLSDRSMAPRNRPIGSASASPALRRRDVRAPQPGRRDAGRVDRARSRRRRRRRRGRRRASTGSPRGGARHRRQRADVLSKAARLLAERADDIAAEMVPRRASRSPTPATRRAARRRTSSSTPARRTG